MKKVILDLKGMTCASCAITIEKALNKKAEGAKAVVNFAVERAIVEGEDIDPDELITIVKNTGYDASLIKIEEEDANAKKSYKVNGMTCASCAITVEKTLKKVPGVTDVSVNIATEKATVVIDPNVVSEREMAKAVSNAGYELVISREKQTSRTDDFAKKVKSAKTKMIWAWAITGPLAIMMIVDMIGLKIPYFDWISVIVSFPVIFIIGYGPIRSGLVALIHRGTNMDVLILLGVTASFTTGILSLAGMKIADYSAVGAMIMGFFLVGKYLETAAKGKASEAIKKLLQMSAKNARILDDDGKEIEIPTESLAVGDIMIVKPSEQIPTDGVILDGDTTVDESMATGESMPVRRSIGDEVIGSTVNQLGTIKVRVTRVGEDTFLSQVIKLVDEAQGTKVPIQAFADKIIGIFVPVVLLTAASVFIFWLLNPAAGHGMMVWASSFLPWVDPNLDALSAAIFAAVATLVIACPCALGLATPTALMVGSGKGASEGILIRSGEALQTAKDVDTVVFDKTGTITNGVPHVTDLESKVNENEFLKIVGSIENYSEHPLGKAIVEYAKSKGVKFEKVEDLLVHPGFGIEGIINGKRIFVTSPRFASSKGITVPLDFQRYGAEGKTMIVAFEEKGKYLGMIALADTIKDGAREAIRTLKEMGIKTVMLTGDNEFTAKSVAHQMDIDDVRYNLLPSDKIEEIKKLQSQSKIVAMVGDGINDAPSLKQANVGIAIGTGTDIAKEASDITLVKGELMGVVKAIKLSKATFQKIRQNLFWAFFYNVVAIPLAGMGLLHPIIAEIAMASSSVNVVTNSLRLKKRPID
ncbi:heavy metal translocating P-type ATPase [Mesoaciditoga lauensis]|uniref:heavy metal translocating P-type ATPase n=1 Tax=Mesoaciditoga lauensis TaxID=1495039 RepID=UPI000560E1FC|nr:heavy metal translocating P-type ATPase [Mesoaciditoga lauensis]